MFPWDAALGKVPRVLFGLQPQRLLDGLVASEQLYYRFVFHVPIIAGSNTLSNILFDFCLETCYSASVQWEKQENAMFDNNDRFEEFKNELDQRGVDIRYAWQARRDGQKPSWPKRPADIAMLLFIGRGFQPSVLCAIAIDYEKTGFGLFIDDGDKIVADADRIAKPRDTTKPHPSDTVVATL